MSNNIFQKSFSLLDDAIKTASQVKRSSIILQDDSGQWKIILTNDRPDFYHDFSSLNIPDNDCFIYINDNNGLIKRNKVQLTLEDTTFLAKCFTNFNTYENPLASQSEDLIQHLQILMSDGIEEENILEDQSNKGFKSGVFDLHAIEFYCYFKKIYPLSLTLEIDTGDSEDIKFFIINLSLNDTKAVSNIESIFRKSNYDINQSLDGVKNNSTIELKLKLKDKILQLVQNDIRESQDFNSAMRMLNPLGKGILNNFSNYDLIDLKLI